MTVRLKQRMAGVVGAIGALLLLLAVAGFIARAQHTVPIVASSSAPPEEISASAQAVPLAQVVQAAAQMSLAKGSRADTVARKRSAHVDARTTEAGDEAAVNAAVDKFTAPTHYPLAVGRYWVYRYHEPDSDVVTRVERRITRRQQRQDESDLYFFEDGTIAYFEDGKIYEMRANGGVNIIPVDLGAAEDGPVMYRSQGLQIEKWLGTSDTAVVIDGHRFERCLEVVTRFRRLDEADTDGVSYSSFYAPGIGLVGRQQWPPDAAGTLAVTLSEYGTRQLPSTVAGQL